MANVFDWLRDKPDWMNDNPDKRDDKKAQGCGFGGHTGQGNFCEMCGKRVGLPILLRESELGKLEKKTTWIGGIVQFGTWFVIAWVVWDVVEAMLSAG